MWRLAREQHGVVGRRQLLEVGLTPKAIEHRLRAGRLHRVRRGVYAVGRPEVSQRGRWLAAVLACGEGALLSHASAAALWELRPAEPDRIEVSVPGGRDVRARGVVVHRRFALTAADRARRHAIPVTSPACTLVDLATRLAAESLEAAVNAADRLGLVDPDRLRREVARAGSRPGTRALGDLLDRRTFTLTDSALERRFLPLAARAGLPAPLAGRRLNGFKVDFVWPDLRLVVETDGLRYHRTPAQQARDRLRDQTHAAAGFVPLRFTHAQVAFEPEHVVSTLAAVARLAARRAPASLAYAVRASSVGSHARTAAASASRPVRSE